MNDADKLLGSIFQEIKLKAISEPMENYQADEQQLNKLAEVFKILKSMKLKPTMDIIPAMMFVDVSVSANSLSLDGDQITKLNKIVEYASAFGIDPLLDGTIEIDITIPSVFKRAEV